MNRLVILSIPCVLAGALVARPRVARAQVAPCTATLDGHVVDARNHEPVAGAIVTVNGEIVGATDAAGRFTLRELCAGPVVITVAREDHVEVRRVLAIPGPRSLELELTPLAEVIEIEGRTPDPEDMRAATVLTGAALDRTRGRALAEALAEIPGVTQLRSASGLSKPIVRGQFGRRLLLLVDGIRHRAQEWGLDHAPEIDPSIADKLTVVRGASGVRYGPDAIGGAVLVESPDLPRTPGVAGELHLIGLSNGHGGSIASRIAWASEAVPGLALRLDGSWKRVAAARTPDYALDNTGVHQGNVGATVGYRRPGFESRLSYVRYQARLGVCSCLRIESKEDFDAQLARDRPIGSELFEADFAIDRPSQAVAHDLAIARARWTIDRLGALTATYALQHDHRREYDVVRQAVRGPQFDFRLMTHELDLALQHDPIHLTDHLHLRGAAGIVGMAQLHHYSGLPLIPDYTAFGAGVYALERLIGHEVEVEAGVRYDLLARTASLERQDFLRLVRSDQLALDACGDADVDPVECDSRFHTLSASLGGLYRLTSAWSAKLDLSTASRPPNPDEQYLNGTAPTFPVLGLGRPDLGAETTYSASLTTSYADDHVTAELSGYANLIDDYIYFAPALDAAGNPIFDVLVRGTFPRFATRPVDALFYGADGGIAIAPVSALELGAQVSIVRARNRTDDSYLVFIPPDRARATVTVKPPSVGGWRAGFLTLAGTVVARQRRSELAADFAPPPPAYFLLGAEAGAETTIGEQVVKVALAGENLLNTRYRDYTSLLRYFADSPGWQLALRISLEFSSR